MQPPICSYCHENFSPFNTGGTLLRFKITAEEQASNERMKNMPHHPKGAHWFCGEHVDAAQALTHLRIRDALTQMKTQFNPQKKSAKPR